MSKMLMRVTFNGLRAKVQGRLTVMAGACIRLVRCRFNTSLYRAMGGKFLFTFCLLFSLFLNLKENAAG